jgi:hypothetical protein|tara:strand:- start:1838 stop:2410 length:573 start_codon:yes stop_codon:yes gene_type:complete
MGRIAGVRSAALRLPRHGSAQILAGKNMQKQSGDTERGSGSPVRSFPSDEDRYEWELIQRFEKMDNMDRWLSADDIYVIGPPLPPGCRTFTHEVPTEAFKIATESGYIAVRPVCEQLGMGRKSVRRMIDRLPILDVAYVVYDGKKARSRYHCRMLHKKSVSLLKRNKKQWIQESKRGGKETTAENIRRSC